MDLMQAMQAAAKGMKAQGTRMRVISENLANADTPGYRPHDIAPLNFKDLLGSSASKLSMGGGAARVAAPSLAGTNSQHMSLGGASGNDRSPAEKAVKNSYETAPVGNAVVLEEQLLIMGNNYAEHRMMTNLYQKNVDMMKASLK